MNRVVCGVTLPESTLLGEDVYEQFYQLSEDPFRLTPDPRYTFAHPSYAKARAYLEYGVQRGEGFVAVTGPPGSGKTSLIEELLTRTPVGVRVNHLISSQLEAEDLLRMVAHTIGLSGDYPSKAVLLHHIRQHLEKDRRDGRRTVLIVDEAQGLDSEALEELRLLTNLTDLQGPLLQIILLGQEQLRELLKMKALEQLRQRMIAAYHLGPMSEEDTKAYVAHRLRCAGWAGDPVISDMAIRIIHHAGGGNPRRINLLCSRLMLHGFVDNKHYLAVPDVRVVLEEMEEEELASWDDSLEELMRSEEAREQEEESRLAHVNHARAAARGGVSNAAGEPEVRVQPDTDRVEPSLETMRLESPTADPVPASDHEDQDDPPAAAPGLGTEPSVDEDPSPESLPELHVGEPLAEPPGHGLPGQRGAAASPAQARHGDRGNGWEWLVGGVLVFLLAALVLASHDPTRDRIRQWLESAQAAVLSEILPPEDTASAGENPSD